MEIGISTLFSVSAVHREHYWLINVNQRYLSFIKGVNPETRRKLSLPWTVGRGDFLVNRVINLD